MPGSFHGSFDDVQPEPADHLFPPYTMEKVQAVNQVV